MKILFENDDYIALVKPCGVLSEGENESVISLLKKEKAGDFYCVHRLDRAVSGVMVYAKSKESAAYFSSLIANGGFEKEYLAVVHGESLGNGEMTDFLFKDSRTNKSFVVKKERKGVRKAHLSFETLQEKCGLSFVKIKLDTGRSHQIRVQFSSRKTPLYGDGKYGASDNCDIALFSHTISFKDKNGALRCFVAYPERKKPWDMFDMPRDSE